MFTASDAPRRLVPLFDCSTSSALSAAAFKAAIRSASIAASSASGMSGMVSKDEMLGLRDRILVGVEGIDDAEGVDKLGYDSLYLEKTIGDECEDGGLPTD